MTSRNSSDDGGVRLSGEDELMRAHYTRRQAEKRRNVTRNVRRVGHVASIRRLRPGAGR
jgi:hypothetical protein